MGVTADGDQLCAQLCEPILQPCQGREFSRSNEGEVGRVEEQNRPLPARLQVRQADRTEVAGRRFVCVESEVGDLRSDLDGFGQGFIPLSVANAAGDIRRVQVC